MRNSEGTSVRSVLTGPIPDKDRLSQADFEKLIWRFRGVLKEQERERAFWSATNNNLKLAFDALAQKERELELAYQTIQDDLAVASQLQESLLPEPSDLMSEELEVAIYHSQLAEVGGDYYDFFTTRGGRYAVGVFDICGHGVPAALVMTYLKAQFMTITKARSSPASVVQWVNDVSLSFMRTVKKYATVNFVEIGPDLVRYVNGGGNGLLVRSNGATSFVKRDQFLGLRSSTFHEYELPFDEGDLLALYTDGMVEAQDEGGTDYSKDRLNGIITDNHAEPVDRILDACVADYQDFRARDSDDITLLLMRRKKDYGN